MTVWQVIRQDAAIRRKCIALFAFLAIVLYGHSYRVGLDTRMVLAEREIQNRQRVIAQIEKDDRDYQKQTAALPQLTQPHEIDLVQNNLIKKMAQYNLDVQAMHMVTEANNPESQSQVGSANYEISVNGSWDAAMKYLHDLKLESKLINVSAMRMESGTSSPDIRTTFRYKIYIERGK